MQDPFVGQITFFPYNFAPQGWAPCAGQLVPIAQFSALFSLLGTSFGGNGTSNFGLPDLQGRVAPGMGQLTGGDDYVIGEKAGVESVTLVSNQMATHNHPLNATTTQGSENNPSGSVFAAPFVGGGRGGGGSTADPYNPGTPNTTLVPATLPSVGNGFQHNNIQPSLVLMPCIALQGVFPQRS